MQKTVLLVNYRDFEKATMELDISVCIEPTEMARQALEQGLIVVPSVVHYKRKYYVLWIIGKDESETLGIREYASCFLEEYLSTLDHNTRRSCLYPSSHEKFIRN